MTFIKFLINGGMLGVLTLLTQSYVNNLLILYTTYHEIFSSLIVITPFIILNFIIQRHFIFSRPGYISRFLISNIAIMIIISINSHLLNLLGLGFYKLSNINLDLSFAISSLLCMPFSYMLKNNYVFKR